MMSESPMGGGGGGGGRRARTASTSSAGSATSISSASAAASSSSASVVIRPQAVTEKSLMESVAGFIQEATSQPHQGQMGFGGGGDPRVHVVWARFEVADVNDPKLFPEGAEVNGNSPPLLLVLGYTQGVQMWLLPMNGEAQEVLSWRQGTVKTLRILPAPKPSVAGQRDSFEHCRPLIVLADSTGPGAAFTSASFISLRSGEQVHNIKFNSEIADIAVNRRVVVVSFVEKLAVFDACNLEARFTITSCYPSPGVHGNPISLGDRWLAYADQKLVSIHRSSGGLETDCSQSVAAWGINVGSKLAQGVTSIYSTLFSSSPSQTSFHQRPSVPASPTSQSSAAAAAASSRSSAGGGMGNEPQKGVVTVLDILKVHKPEREEVNVAEKIDGVVAHFIAHNKAIVALQFDHTGSLLLTCDRVGNYFNLFRIVPHPAGSGYAAVHHLYSLYRGDTPGSVQDISFSPDSRWVAVSTLRGTTHIFPITPYGGQVGVRTHTSPRVVNRLSRFHRSAGIDESRTAASAAATAASGSSGRNSPNPNLAGTSPGVGSSSFGARMSDAIGSGMPGISGAGAILSGVMPFPTPHVPPFPTPTLVQPVAQLRQPYIVTLTNQTIGSATSVSRKKSVSGSSSSGGGGAADEVPIRLATAFAPSRAWLPGGQFGGGSGGSGRFGQLHSQHQRRPHDSLFVMANHGVLLEYTLDAVPDSTLTKEKICESSPIELMVSAFGQWSLIQPRDRAELQPPLPIDNPLMIPALAASTPPHASSHHHSAHSGHDGGDEDKWLSQVEILTHFGPHRRLWMGPQFAFKTFQHTTAAASSSPLSERLEEEELLDLDISLPSRPHEQSNPVLIEAGSASSFEMSPRFSQNFSGAVNIGGGGGGRHPSAASSSSGGGGGGGGAGKGSREKIDLESELQEAMSENVGGGGGGGEDTLLDGPARFRRRGQRTESSEEEFFCLTPDDPKQSRSRNASSSSGGQGQQQKFHPMAAPRNVITGLTEPFISSSSSQSVADTKIFSVAVEATSRLTSKMDSMKVCDLDTGFSGQFAIVSPKVNRETGGCAIAAGNKGSKSKEEEDVTTTEGSKAKKSKKKKSSKEKKAEVESLKADLLKAAKTRVIESPPKELLVDLDADSQPPPPPSAAKVVRPERPQRVTSTAVKVEVDNEKEDEEEPFFIKEDNNDEDDEDFEAVAAVDPESTARPRLPSWASDLIKTDESIIAGIESAGKKYDGSPQLVAKDANRGIGVGAPLVAKEEKSAMTTSSGFDVDFPCLDKKGNEIKSKKKSSLEEDDEDEEEFSLRPAYSRKEQRRQKKQRNKKTSESSETSLDSEVSSMAASPKGQDATEGEKEIKSSPNGNNGKGEDGWSFDDDIDINKMIDEVVGGGCQETEEEEKTPLEDVFKFDSELAKDEMDEDEDEREDGKGDEEVEDANKKMSVSLEDLKDALNDDVTTTDNDSENDFKECSSGAYGAGAKDDELRSRKKMTTSLNVKFDEEAKSSSEQRGGGGMSASAIGIGSQGSTSESSVGNSPNPKKNKGKKKKKRR